MNITVEQNRRFIYAFLIDQMWLRDFKVKLEGNDAYLGSYFQEMLKLKYIRIEGDIYIVDVKGQDFSENFTQKYNEFLKFYDIFCAVDLETGEFAFSKYFDFETDEEWKTYLNQERFSDVRIAVCRFKKIDPTEILFMSFMNEGRFETSNLDWQMDLISLKTWKEIFDICDTAITLEDDVTIDIITQGSLILQEIFLKDADLKSVDTEVIETTEIVKEVIYANDLIYFEPYYYDPFYVSPCWFLFL